MRERGFTLTELLVALAIAALLLGLAAPGFGRQRANVAVRSAASQTMGALHLARRLALARGQSVTVCPSPDGRECGFEGKEWMLFANDAGGSDGRRDAGELVLRRWFLPAGVQTSGTRGYAAFQSRPGAAATVTFEFRHAGTPGAGRDVVVSQTGRPRLRDVDFLQTR
jgi:type IV fimbrial biogenesis protein FimT